MAPSPKTSIAVRAAGINEGRENDIQPLDEHQVRRRLWSREA